MEKKENDLMKLAILAIAAFIIILLGGSALSMHLIDTYLSEPSAASSWHNIVVLIALFAIFTLNWTAFSRHRRNYNTYKIARTKNECDEDFESTRALLAVHTMHLIGTVIFALYTIVMLIVASVAGRPPYEVYLIGASLVLAEAASITVFIKLQ